MNRELLKQALDAIEGLFYRNDDADRSKAISIVEKIELNLAKPGPEPICSSCKAIGAAYSIGKETLAPASDREKQLEAINAELVDAFGFITSDLQDRIADGAVFNPGTICAVDYAVSSLAKAKEHSNG